MNTTLKTEDGTTTIEADPNLPGTHRPEGIVALSGAGLVPGRTLAANLHDIAPTILSLFGLPIPEHVEGRPIAGLAIHSTTRVDSPSVSMAGPHGVQFEYTPEEQILIEQRLADLGYLE